MVTIPRPTHVFQIPLPDVALPIRPVRIPHVPSSNLLTPLSFLPSPQGQLRHSRLRAAPVPRSACDCSQTCPCFPQTVASARVSGRPLVCRAARPVFLYPCRHLVYFGMYSLFFLSSMLFSRCGTFLFATFSLFSNHFANEWLSRTDVPPHFAMFLMIR